MSKDKFLKRDNRGNKKNRKNKRIIHGVCPDGCGGFYPEHTFAADGYCEICGYCLK